MKLVCDARALRGALDLCDQVVPAKTTLDALHHAVLDARADGTFSLTATDLTVRVRCTVPATVDEPGRVTMPVKQCSDWLDEVDDLSYPVELSSGESRLEWRVGPFQLRSALINVDDVPDQQPAPDVGRTGALPGGVRIDAAALASVLPSLLAVATGHAGRVHFNAEYSLVGVYAIAPNHAVLAVLNNLYLADADWCIPIRALELLPKEGALHIGANEHVMVLYTDAVEVVVRLDQSVKPVPAIMDLLHDRELDDDFLVPRRDLTRLFGTGALLKTPAVLRYQPRKRLLQVRGTGDGGDDVRAEVVVADGPKRSQEVTIDCERLQRVARALPGDALGINLGGDVFGGPGVRLWPADELPDSAMLLHGLRAHAAVVEGEEEDVAA